MVATRSRVGIPQAFISLPYLCLDYLPHRHANKPVTSNSCLCALNVGKEIPIPLRLRECFTLPTIRSSPHTPITITNN